LKPFLVYYATVMINSSININSDDQQFYQYQQCNQSRFTSNH